MGSIFTAVERKIIETVDGVVDTALRSAAYELGRDVMENICYRISESYYNEYTPKKYRRMNSLYDIWSVNTFLIGDGLKVKMHSDSDRLPQHSSNSYYHKSGGDWVGHFNRSNGSNNGLPDNEWIYENFWSGIHPVFYVDRKTGGLVNNSRTFPGAETKAAIYVGQYQKNGTWKPILIKHLKQACKSYSG